MNELGNISITAPVLLIGFNRPNVIRESFAFIRASKPAILYVAIDQAREDVIGELQLVNEVKEIVQEVDWDCQVSFKFNETNLGAEKTVSQAVSWVLESEETVIVLEDDIIAPKAFFLFAQEMLKKYLYSEEVYMISSNQFTPYKMTTDYAFSIYGHSNGWATWRRAWDKFDLDTEVSDVYLEILNNLQDQYSEGEIKFLINRFEKMKSYGIGGSTWDLCWFYTRFINRGLTIVPNKNLTSNIGVYGLHATGITETHFRDYDETFICSNVPEEILRDVKYDLYHFKNYMHYDNAIIRRIWRRIKRICKIDNIFFNLRRKMYESKKQSILKL